MLASFDFSLFCDLLCFCAFGAFGVFILCF